MARLDFSQSAVAVEKGERSLSAMLQLTDDDVLRMKSLGREVCTHVAYSARRTESSKSAVRWTSIGFENDVELFDGEDADTNDSNRALSYMCGVTHVSATIEQVADLFNATDVDSNADVRDFYAQFHADLAHTQLIAPIRSRSRQYPRHMITLKAATMLSPTASGNPATSSRDFVYLESQEDVMDAKRKKRGWVCAMHSIDLSNVPSPPDCVRGSLYRSGFVFTESDVPGELEAIYLLQIDFKGAVATQLRHGMMKQRIMCLQVLSDHFARVASAPQQLLNRHASPHQAHGQNLPPPSNYRQTQPSGGGYPEDLRQPRDAPYRHTSPPQQHQHVDPTSRYPGNNNNDQLYQSYGRQHTAQPFHQSLQSQQQQHVLTSEQVQLSGSGVNGYDNQMRTQASPGPTGLHLLGDIQLKPKQSAAQCACCVAGFNFMKKKHNCRVCGEVVCSSCCTQQRPVVPIEGIKKYHICTLCTMDNRRSVARTTASSHTGPNNMPRSKSEHTRSVLSGVAGGNNNVRSPKSSLSGTMQQQRYRPPNQPGPQQQQLLQDPRQGGTVHLRQPASRGPHYPEDLPPTDVPLSRTNAAPPSNMYPKQQGFAPTMAQNYQPGHPPQHHHPQQHQGMHPSSQHRATHHMNNGGYHHPSHHQYNPRSHAPPPPPHMAHHPVPRGGYRQPPPTHEYAASMASANYPVPRYNGTNKPDDPRMSMLRDERESFLNLYDEVGTSVSRAQPLHHPYRHPSATDNSLASRPLSTQEVYIPPDAPTTTAVNLGDLRNAPDVLAALNNSRTGGGAPSGLRLEIISPSTNNRQPDPESEPYGGGSSGYDYGRVAPLQQAATPPSSATPVAPQPAASTPDATLVPQQLPGIYKGSRYRIKETRYYAPSPDANPDDYVAQERDSILVDMPSQSPAPLTAAATSPTALTVSRFLDHDIDMFLQPMDSQTAAGAPLLEDGKATATPAVNELLLRLQQQDTPSATPTDSTDSDVVALTRLLVDRLRGATDAERAAIRGALAAAVQ